MNKRKYVIIILLCMAAWLQAQDSVKAFDEFFVTGMKKIEGVFPVYVAEKEVCLLYTSPSPRDAHESRMPSSA